MWEVTSGWNRRLDGVKSRLNVAEAPWTNSVPDKVTPTDKSNALQPLARYGKPKVGYIAKCSWW